MQKIGEGLQFSVYDKGNKRVIKIPTGRDHIKKLLSEWNPEWLNTPNKIKTEVEKAVRERGLYKTHIRKQTNQFSFFRQSYFFQRFITVRARQSHCFQRYY